MFEEIIKLLMKRRMAILGAFTLQELEQPATKASIIAALENVDTGFLIIKKIKKIGDE